MASRLDEALADLLDDPVNLGPSKAREQARLTTRRRKMNRSAHPRKPAQLDCLKWAGLHRLR
jgi:hypothetical protein